MFSGSFRKLLQIVFEDLVMALAKRMPVKSIANLLKEHNTCLWRVLDYYVHESCQDADLSSVTDADVNETSSKRGHNYVTLFVNLPLYQILFATDDKDAAVLPMFRNPPHLKSHQGEMPDFLKLKKMSLKTVRATEFP